MPGEVISVTLSRPWPAATPMITPSTAPGLSSTGTLHEHAWAISSAAPSSLATSSPMMAAGTTPKSLSAE